LKSSIVAYVFLAAVTFLQNRCLEKIAETHADRPMGVIYELRCSGGPGSIIKTGSAIQNLREGEYTDTQIAR
jgi:hypothetical protein